MVQTTLPTPPPPGPAPPYTLAPESQSQDTRPELRSYDRSPSPYLENGKSSTPTGPATHPPTQAISSNYVQPSSQKPYSPYEMSDVWESIPPPQGTLYSSSTNSGLGQPPYFATNPNHQMTSINYAGVQSPPHPMNNVQSRPPPQSEAPVDKKGSGILSMFGGSSKKGIEDVYIAVMGVTGSGKSSFISLCTKQSIVIGHKLESCTMEVEDFSFMWNNHIRVHLIDTPGFDDTKRKDTDVLRDIAGWMAVTYTKKIKLSGIIYLHRITDPRMGGTQMRNLTMFKELCGSKCFPAVILVTTFWGAVDPAIGADRELQLRSNDEFWGYMAKKGSQIVRHSGGRESAMNIVESIVKRQRTIVLDIQDDMVNKGLDLDETLAGQSLNRELIEQRKKHQQEMKILEADMRKAIAERDEESVEAIAQMQREFQNKIDQGNKDVQDLQTSLENLKEERDREFKKIQDELKERAEEYARREQEWNDYKESNTYDPEENERREMEMQNLREQLQDLVDRGERKKTGVWHELGELFEDVVQDVRKWWKEL